MAMTNPLTSGNTSRAPRRNMINTKVTGGKNEYDVFKTRNGNYYFMYQGRPIMIDKKYNNYMGKNYKSVVNLKLNPTAKTSSTPTKTTNYASALSSGGSGGGGTSGAMSTPGFEDWQNLSNEEVAGRLGLKGYKYEDILANLDQAAAAKFNEIDTTLKRTQSQNLRGLEENYSNYVNTLRADKANAISSGITKGQAAAMQILSGITGNKAISDSQQKINDEIFKVAQERGTMLADNKNLARTQSDAWQQYLATLKGTYQANEVNQYAADVAATAQKYAADAQTRAAGISSAATRYAAAAGGNSEIEYLKFLMENPLARSVDASMRK